MQGAADPHADGRTGGNDDDGYDKDAYDDDGNQDRMMRATETTRSKEFQTSHSGIKHPFTMILILSLSDTSSDCMYVEKACTAYTVHLHRSCS